MTLVSRLSVLSWVRLTPALIAAWIRGRAPLRVEYFAGTPAGLRLLTALSRLRWATGGPIEFCYIDILTADGSLAGPRIEAEDSLAFCTSVAANIFEGHPLLKRFGATDPHTRLFLERCLAESVAPVLMEIAVAAWRGRGQGLPMERVVLVTARPPWADALGSYARDRGVTLRFDRLSVGRPKIRARDTGRAVRALWRAACTRLNRRQPLLDRRSTEPAPPHSGPVVAVSYQGKGVSFDPARNSDVFWVPFARLAPGQVLLCFSMLDDPLDAAKLRELDAHGVRAVATEPSAAAPGMPTWRPVPDVAALGSRVVRLLRAAISWPRGGVRLHCWLGSNLAYFSLRVAVWRAFFRRYAVRVNVDYNDWTSDRLAANVALSELGGVSVSFQRQDEPVPILTRARTSDVHFGFGFRQVAIERTSRSAIGEFVIAGYPFDQAFTRTRGAARALRRQLEAHGARFVVCFFDENSVGDPRRGPSHVYRAENYRFLLERLLEDPTLGLVFKPKKASSLRARLGEHVRLLDRALGTGRCVLFDQGVVATPVLPCEASQAADVAIGLLFGSTAALESALAGTRTVFVDRERLRGHPLWDLGAGRVVFPDWHSLWCTLEQFRRDPASQPRFGIWSPAIELMDPYRDGRAAERIGRYVGWLAEVLAGGASPGQAIGAASKRFRDRWGADMIIGQDQPASERAAARQLAPTG